jgi:DNA-binding transcriptional LysR family regulator
VIFRLILAGEHNRFLSRFHVPGEVVGRVRLSVPRAALPFVIDPVVPEFRARHPRIDVDGAVDDLLRHECITFRSQTTGALYASELERGRRSCAQRSAPLRLLVEAAKELAVRAVK